jgi:RNA polymerase sigma factor (sigma-70 family)
MEALARINTETAIKQTNSIVLKHSQNKLCKNRMKMPFKELIEHISKKLMPYAMVLTSNDSDDAWDLMQHTIEKLLINRETLESSNYPMAYAKKILLNKFRDNCRKEKKHLSIQANDIEITNKGFQEEKLEYQTMLECLEAFDEEDKIILAMLGAGHSYTEIQEVVSDYSMANLRVKANRARIKLAQCMDRKL